jgi:hypothetical protein
VEIGVTDTRRFDLDNNLPWTRLWNWYLFDDERLMEGVYDCRFHCPGHGYLLFEILNPETWNVQ